jgi:dipeptidase
MAVALGRATVDGQTLLGHNSDRPSQTRSLVSRIAGREHAPGEKINTEYLELLQVRQTCTVLANQPDGWWGYSYGLNEHGVAIGGTILPTRLPCPQPGLTGGDLVRLVLERSHSARQAVDLLAGLVERHGQGAGPACAASNGDQGFLIADASEAFAVETAGRHWVYQEIQEVRAVSNVSIIRQDWDWISHGLAAHAIAEGLWPGDGSKLDFAGSLSPNPIGQSSGLRRWGRATYLLEQQNGHIDPAFFRHLLSDHYEGTHFEVDPLLPSPGPVPVCQHGNGPEGCRTAASFVTQFSADPGHLPVFWSCFGPPCQGVYLPLFVEGELPQALAAGESGNPAPLGLRFNRLMEALGSDRESWDQVRSHLNLLQARFDSDAQEFAVDGAILKRRGERTELQRQAGLFMQQCQEQLETVLADLETRSRKAGIHAPPMLVSDF